MTVWSLVVKEVLHRKINFIIAFLSVVVAVGCLIGSLTLLKVHDLRTRQVLEQKEKETSARLAVLEDEMRKAMLTLGFNVVILPKDQNLSDWHSEDYASKYMPEEYVSRLASSNIITIQHLLPSLQRKVLWPEQKRTIILIGTRGEVPSFHKPMVQPVPRGTIVLGWELHQSLGLKVGDAVKLLGRDFVVHNCHPQRGSKDDITAWIELGEAQEMLGKQGLINAILALECQCAWANVGKVREEIGRILPDTQVIEKASEALARAEARTKVGEEAKAALEHEKQNRQKLREERERFAAILVPLAIVGSVVWIGLLAFGNVRERRVEIAILRAMGLRSRQVLFLFLSKAILIGAVGGVMGCLAGFLVGKQLGIGLEQVGPDLAIAPTLAISQFSLLTSDFWLLTSAVGLLFAPILTTIASWIPAVLATQQDPAIILSEE